MLFAPYARGLWDDEKQLAWNFTIHHLSFCSRWQKILRGHAEQFRALDGIVGFFLTCRKRLLFDSNKSEVSFEKRSTERGKLLARVILFQNPDCSLSYKRAKTNVKEQ